MTLASQIHNVPKSTERTSTTLHQLEPATETSPDLDHILIQGFDGYLLLSDPPFLLDHILI